jgi:single-stranded DNA-binding protein
MKNFLLRSWVSGRLHAERWETWEGARRAKTRLESVGHKVTIQWLTPHLRLYDVTDETANPEART